MSALDIARAVGDGSRRAADVIDEHLSRIAAVDPKVDAFLLVLHERARRRAAEVDAAVAAGAKLPLAGVPVAVKDVLDVAGYPTTCGSKILENYRPPFTATCLERLEEKGAIIVGKTNMDEFAMGSSTEHSAYKNTKNPWDLDRVPGGSSGGSAAAVAACLAPIALGTDTGGSIRQPAALCGVLGLKPTYGRISRYGLVAFASSLDQVGVFSRNVGDAIATCEALFGVDTRDATSATVAVGDLSGGVGLEAQGLRVGVPRSVLAKGLDESVLQAFEASLKVLERCGARLVDVELPHMHHAIATYYIVATAEASSNLARFDGVRYGLRAGDAKDLRHMYGASREAGFGDEVKRRIILGTFVLSSGYYDAYYVRAQKVRTLIRRDFEAAFAHADVIATPTTPTPAFRFGEKTGDPLQMYLADYFTVPANLAGNPGISIPGGFVEGLPVGLQFLGRPFDEATLFRAAAAFEAATDHHLAKPPLEEN